MIVTLSIYSPFLPLLALSYTNTHFDFYTTPSSIYSIYRHEYSHAVRYENPESSLFFFSYSNHIISSHLHDTKGLTRPLPPLLQLQAMYLKLLTASKLNFPLTVGSFVATRLKFWLLVSYVSLGVITHFMRCHYYWYTTYNRLMILMTILPLFCP